MPEQAEQGWKTLAEMFGLSERRMMDRREEMERLGVIFYMKKGLPPQRTMHFFPSTVRAYAMKKAQSGEII